MELGEPLHRLGGCGPLGQGDRGGEGGGRFDQAGGPRLRHRLHILSQARDQDLQLGSRGRGPAVQAGEQDVAAERAHVRRLDGLGQEGDGGEARRRAGADLASELRLASAGHRRGQRVQPEEGGEVRERGPRGHPQDGELENRHRARDALLGVGDQAPVAGGQDRLRRGPWELHPRHRQVHREHPRRRHPHAGDPHRHAAGLRA
mmetsp:Transcript_88921/g.173977  ORF Transcript_88921/g.173977 Transcript_88921/m.173977 type:complete len:204 (+) Transcript_88921:127-738(+)